MKNQDIVVYKEKLGVVSTLASNPKKFVFVPVEQANRYRSSELDIIEDKDVREATPEEKLRFIKETFAWGNIIKIHTIGNYQIVEYDDSNSYETKYGIFIDYKNMSHAYDTLDKAIIAAIAYNHEGYSSGVTKYIYRMLNM